MYYPNLTFILLQQARSLADTAINEACQYLSEKLPHITSPFQMAIVAYALSAARHSSREDAYSLLKRMKRESKWISVMISFLKVKLWSLMPALSSLDSHYDLCTDCGMAGLKGKCLFTSRMHEEGKGSVQPIAE